MQFLETPHLWGGSTPDDDEFDCSGLLQWTYRTAANPLPPTAVEQWFSTARPEPGDPVFFADANGPDITYFGIYIDGGLMLNAPAKGDVVKMAALDAEFWRAHLAGHGRVPS